ncbi:MAG: hypothetical protein ABWY18_12010, partial [Tardiphaga sp.]
SACASGALVIANAKAATAMASILGVAGARMASKLSQGAGLRKPSMLVRVENYVFYPDAVSIRNQFFTTTVAPTETRL